MTTRTPTRRTWRFVVRCSAAAGFAALAADSLAADRSWTNTAGGTFSTAANWQNSLVPGVNDVANFNNSSIFFPPGQTNYTISFAGNTQNQAVKVKNDFVTFNLLGRTYTTTQTTGNEIGTVAGGGSVAVARSARLTIQNGTFNFTGITPQMLIGAVPGGIGTLAIGADGIVTGSPNLFFGTASAAGTLTVNGGTMTVATLSLGSGASGNGTASIVGPFSSVTTTRLLVGDAGAGTMSMTIGAIFQNNGSATIGNATNSSGLVDVDGATVRWNQTGALTVGNSGAGTINVINGGSLNAAAAVLGNNSSAFGRLNVAGSNSRARFTDLTIGNNGVGSLSVTGGGSVNCTGSFTSIGNTGAAFVSITSGGAWSTDGTATLANASLSTAQVSVDGAGSRWTNSGSMTIGKLGTASLSATNGGDITSSGTCVIADNAEAFVRVDGNGSSFVTFAPFTAGRAGSATVDVLNGGFLQTQSATLGTNASGSATVTVNGQGSNWTLTDNGTPKLLTVGVAGSATLNLTSGGDVLAADVLIGTGGRVLVDGVSSRLIVSSGVFNEGGLTVNGRLDIGNNGVAESVRGFLNGGSVAVSGASSRWSLDTHLIVDGLMTVSSGALVQQGAEGSIRNGGAMNVGNGTWSIGTDLFVGGTASAAFGSGSLNVNPGGFVSLPNTMVIWNNGTTNLNGGQLHLGSIDFRGSTFNFNSGTLRFTGVVNFDSFFLDKLLGNPRTLGPNRTLIIDTTPTLSSLFILGGGILTVPQLAVGSPLQFDSGTFNLTAANLTIGNTGLFGNTVVLDTRNINVTNSTNIQPGSKLFMLGGHFSSGAGITNNGEIIVNSPFTANFTHPITNNGEIRVATGASANFSGNVTGIGSFTGGGAKFFKSPSNSSVGAIDSTGSTVVEAGATLAADRIREQSLTVNGNVNINPGGTDASTSRLNALSITGGRLNLSDNTLVVDYTGPSPIDNIRALLTSGFAGGSWNGPGINSSTAASAPNRALGFAEATDIGAPAVFAGQAIDATTVLIRFTLPGDANLDRSVNISDFSLLAANFNQPSTWFRGDFNYDGTTNIGDFSLLAANFNLSLPVDVPRGSAIPEPAGAAVLLLAALRRRGA